MMATFLSLRFVGEAFVVSPNNLTALRALPESQVMMASGLLGLLCSVSSALGTALAAVLWDQSFGRHFQRYAEESPAGALGLTTALLETQNTLVWMGEIATQVSAKTVALVQRQLQAEASTAAWQDYLIYNGP